MNIRLLRKVERLESMVSLTRGPEPMHPVVEAALNRLSTADLRLLIDALRAQRPYSEWSNEQVSACERLQSAMEAECVQAGFKSAAEFNRLYPGTISTTIHNKIQEVRPLAIATDIAN
jgi:hypothetical protein